MSTDGKERTTDLGRLVHACDSLAEVKHELAAVVAAARGAEDPHEARGISHVASRTHRRLSDTLNIVSGVAASLRENGASPPESSGTLTLSEEEVREIVLDFYRVVSATSLDKDSDEEEIRRRLAAIARLSEVSADQICEAAGIPVHDGTIKEFVDAARPFGEKAAEVGQGAVLDPVRSPNRFQASDRPERREEVHASVELKLTRRDVHALNVLISAAILASDGTLGMMTELPRQEITPSPVRAIWRAVLEHTETAIEKIEGASPYSGDELLDNRGDALKELVMEATEGMES